MNKIAKFIYFFGLISLFEISAFASEAGLPPPVPAVAATANRAPATVRPWPQCSCQSVINSFLKAPTKQNFAFLEKTSLGCWSIIKSSNQKLDELNRLVAGGDVLAAHYLAPHLRDIDGGNLEDSLIALGNFSDHEMEDLLDLAKRGLLAKGELTDALTMLPLPLSDDPQAQINLLKSRGDKLRHIVRPDLISQKEVALSAINEFLSEIISNKN